MKKILLICFVFAFTSCKDSFLDRGSLVALSPSNFWKTEKDAQLGVNAVYDAIQDRHFYSGTLNGDIGLPLYDNFGDNSFGQYKFEGAGNFMEASIGPDQYTINNFWVAAYRGIARANLAIENISAMPEDVISKEKRDQYVGQALFLRSLFYFNLAVYFGDVPLILKVQNLDEAYVPKNTFKEVSDQVIKDLKTAANLLPASYSSDLYGYATKGAALGLLARMCLYTKDYQGVIDATTPMLTLGYSLNPSYAQLFTPAGELSNEIVFSVRFSETASNNNELFSATYYNMPKVDAQPMPNLVKDYYCKDGLPISQSPLYNPANEKNNRDPRLTASIYFIGDVFLVDQNKKFTKVGAAATGYGQKKYIRNQTTVNNIATFGAAGQDFIVIRYADVLLMRAEALVELNQLGDVAGLVNQVRNRVGMPTVANAEGANNAVLGQNELRNIVRHERRVELALEGLRYYDLKRWNDVQAAFGRALADKATNYTPSYQPGKSEIFPIPQKAIEANNKLIQNPVWQ